MRVRPVSPLLVMPHGVDGIKRFAPGMIRPGFGERWNEFGVIGAGDRSHRVAVGVRRHSAAMLVRWTARGDEVNFVEVKTALRGARDCQVPDVNRIKRAAKQRNPAYA